MHDKKRKTCAIENSIISICRRYIKNIKIAPKLSKDTIIIVNSCGDAKKDRDILRERLGKK